MAKPSWQEPLEQWAGHFVALGIVCGWVLGPFALFIYMQQEFGTLKLWWPLKGQYPPGKPIRLYRYRGGWSDAEPVIDRVVSGFGLAPMKAEGAEILFDKVQSEVFTQMDRVDDMIKDLKFKLSGCVIGCVANTLTILYLTGVFSTVQ